MKLEITNRRKLQKTANLWKLNNTFLNSQWIKEETTRVIIKNLEMNGNENTTYQNLGDTAKVVLSGKFMSSKYLH